MLNLKSELAFSYFPLMEKISESHCFSDQTSVGRCRQKTRCFPNEVGIADFHPIISAEHQSSLKWDPFASFLQWRAVTSCHVSRCRCAFIKRSPNSECPLCPHQAQPHLSHFSVTFYLPFPAHQQPYQTPNGPISRGSFR